MNAESVIARAVRLHKEQQGEVFDDDHAVELVVDNSAIVIAELESDMVDIAQNLGTTRERVVDWSADVGEALTLLDQTLAENERLKAVLGIAKAHLEVGRNVEHNDSYIQAALEVLEGIERATVKRHPVAAHTHLRHTTRHRDAVARSHDPGASAD